MITRIFIVALIFLVPPSVAQTTMSEDKFNGVTTMSSSLTIGTLQNVSQLPFSFDASYSCTLDGNCVDGYWSESDDLVDATTIVAILAVEQKNLTINCTSQNCFPPVSVPVRWLKGKLASSSDRWYPDPFDRPCSSNDSLSCGNNAFTVLHNYECGNGKVGDVCQIPAMDILNMSQSYGFVLAVFPPVCVNFASCPTYRCGEGGWGDTYCTIGAA